MTTEAKATPMRFGSTRGKSPMVGLSDALLAGLAPDGGLYVPEQLPPQPDCLRLSLRAMRLPTCCRTSCARPLPSRRR
jgi:Threonine synthase N terminus